MGELSRYPLTVVIGMQPVLQPHYPTPVPLTPVPEDLTVWRASTPWQTVRSMLGLVIVCFFISQIAVLIGAGFVDGDMNGTLGPFDPVFTFLGGICLSPVLLLFFFSDVQRLRTVFMPTRPTKAKPFMHWQGATW